MVISGWKMPARLIPSVLGRVLCDQLTTCANGGCCWCQQYDCIFRLGLPRSLAEGPVCSSLRKRQKSGKGALWRLKQSTLGGGLPPWIVP